MPVYDHEEDVESGTNQSEYVLTNNILEKINCTIMGRGTVFKKTIKMKMQ